MKLRLFLVLLTTLLSGNVLADEQLSKTNAIKRVLYITLDGLRWEDILNQKENMPIFWNKYASKAKIYGRSNQKDHTMEVASTPISLPSYQSQMSGMVTNCQDNDCGQIQTETFPEYLVKTLHFHPADVVSISCWDKMADAIEKTKGTITSSSGIEPMKDPYTKAPDLVMQVLNTLQTWDYDRSDERLDKYTYAQALHYLKKYKPKFMYVSFGEADDFAHGGDRASYLKTIAYYDKILDALFVSLQEMSIYNETLIIVSTDHGRGSGDEWTDHGDEYKGSKRTWAFVLNGELVPASVDNGIKRYSTLSIRPTVEQIFGGSYS